MHGGGPKVRERFQRRRRGRLAQEIARQFERKHLEKQLPNPEAAVIPVWNEIGRGYGILSCETDRTPCYIKVKTGAQSAQKLTFVVTQNEWKQSQALPNYNLYVVLNAESRRPIVRVLLGKDLTTSCLAPVKYIASLRIGADGEAFGRPPTVEISKTTDNELFTKDDTSQLRCDAESSAGDIRQRRCASTSRAHLDS